MRFNLSVLHDRIHYLAVFIILLVSVSGIQTFGQSPVTLDNPAITYRLDSQTGVVVDSYENISFEQVVQASFQSRFLPPAKGSLTFGYEKKPIWLKVKAKNTQPNTFWYLEIPAPFLEYVDFYQLEQNEWKRYESGYYRPHNIRAVSHTGHILPLHFNSDSSSTVYIRIAGLSPKTFPLYTIEKERFYEKTRFEDIGYGVFFGILIVMLFYNLFIYLTLKQINYLLYICTIVCTFSIFASASGYGGKYLWPESPMMNYYAGRLSLGVLSVSLTIFTIRFLEVKKYSTIMYYILYSIIPLAVIAMLLVITNVASSAGNNLISISTIVYMTSGIVCRIKGNKTAVYFIAAWAVYLIGGLLLTLRNSGVFEFNFWTTHFVEIGATLETVIIAFALGDRYRRYKLETEEAQLLALKIQQEATEKLEIKVNERTEELSRANEELHATLETNKQQTKIIENKNAELDAFFYRISHDLKGPISSLLGLSFLAKLEVKDQQALEYLDKQHKQVIRLNDIITGLINLTKLNHTDLQKERIDFQKMVDECIQSFTGINNFENIVFHKNIKKDIEFYSEWALLNAILQNLIENAIKYSGNKNPFVNIIITNEKGCLLITVEDNGQGIPQEYQEKIFDMFFRATHTAQGTGLGLYILKRSVDRLGGTIQLRSEVDEGSTFTVKLPFASV